MLLDELLDRLERVQKSGANYTARCPAHQDRAPSLSIREGDDRLLLFCHAGCDQDSILDAIGLSWKDIVYSTDEEPEAVYPYVDEGGKLLYEVVRFPGKQFRQRKADGTWNLNGTRRVLYRLPEILYGIEQGKTIYLCEGEKDAEALRSLGKIATCSPGGASNWRDEYASFLTDAKVIVVQDKDEPGRAYAKAVVDSLRGLAKCRVVEAKEGKDAHDHLVKHGLAVEEFQHPTGEDGDEIALPIKSVRQFAANLKPYNDEKDYLGPFLHGGHRIHVAGPTGHGKTTFMLEAESAAIRGVEFLGWQGRGNVRALHIDLEMPEELLHQAVIDARLDGADGVDLLHLPDGLEVDTNPSHRRMIEKACEGYDIVCIDPFYKLVGHELDYAATRSIIGLLDGLRARHPRMAMVVGFHCQEPYNMDQRLGMASISGFKTWHRPADVVLTFQRLRDNNSRIVWCKNRSAQLGVNVEEEWAVHWARGQGFQRVFELGDNHVPGVFGS